MILNTLLKFEVLSHFMQKWIQPPTCLDHGLHVLKPQSFPPNCASKILYIHQLFFGLQLISNEIQHPAIQIEIEQHFGGFFHQITVSQLIVIRTSRRLDSCLHEAAQNFLKYFQIFKSEIKKSKTYSGWCPFEVLSNCTTLMFFKMIFHDFIFYLI
jgi:hypothetical protein